MNRSLKICIMIAFIIQIVTFIIIDVVFFQNVSIYETANEKKNNKVMIYKDNDVYTLKLEKNGKLIERKTLESGYKKVEEATWISEDFVMFSYVDDNYHTITLPFNFLDVSASSNSNSYLEAAKKGLEAQKEKEKKLLEKEDHIKEQMGISFKKNSTIAVTYDYGKHWKDTGISISESTFPNGDLRLSEDSYYLSPMFSYFYYLDRGWLMYSYSLDEGSTWNTNEVKVSGIEAVWFKSGLHKEQPYFFMADKLNANLIFYQSVDNGISFQQYHSDLKKDMNLLYDTSYIRDDLMFVTYYQYGEIYRSTNHGVNFEAIQVDNLDNISQLYAPTEKDGVLQMIGIHTNKKEVIFTSNDNGSTWIRN